MHCQDFSQRIFDLLTRVERRVRILKDHLNAAPQSPCSGRIMGQDVFTAKANLPTRRFIEPDQTATEGRLATAALADQPDRLSRRDRQRDAVNRLQHLTWSPLQPRDHSPAKREVLDDVPRLDEWHRAWCHAIAGFPLAVRRRGAHAVSRSAMPAASASARIASWR